MITTRRKIFLALALALLAAPSALAQKTSEPSAPKADDNYVTSKMFQSRVFDVKNRDPQNLSRVLWPLTSGFKGAVVSPNDEFRTITVRDFPENIAVIEEAIRRLDTPEPARPAIEFRVHLLVASNDDAVTNRYPAELSDLVKQLQSSLGYKNFSLMGSQIVRSKEGRGDSDNRGVADLRLAGDSPANKNPVFYEYNLSSITLDNAGGQARVQVGEFKMDMKVPLSLNAGSVTYESVGFKNPVSLREGERVVVGTTSIADKSVVVVISVSTMK
ncbi:MAG TPA: secretin N-terminal domain-containing protein [Pyrinomonadaceae bacterium]|jgi:type II secretory pathway component GspD/PulD (secretin)|nr:secretin N-terminal domain-containing protein [Pyrinomonadaceae bacterium]